MNKMTDILQEFVDALPSTIKEQVEGKKNKKVLMILDENDIAVPEYILDALAAKRAEIERHDNVMDSMRPYKDRDVSTVDCQIIL